MQLPPAPEVPAQVRLPAQIVVCLTWPRYCPALMGPPNDGESVSLIIVMEIERNTIEEALLPEEEQSKGLVLLREMVQDPEVQNWMANGNRFSINWHLHSSRTSIDSSSFIDSRKTILRTFWMSQSSPPMDIPAIRIF